MKKLLILLVTIVAGIAFLECAVSGASGGTINTSALQKAFKNASPADKAEVQKAISAIKSQDYPAAMTSLGKVASSTNLTSAQKSAVQKTMSQVKTNELGGVQKTIGGAGNVTTQDLNKAVKP
jgi:hypothetical protein